MRRKPDVVVLAEIGQLHLVAFVGMGRFRGFPVRRRRRLSAATDEQEACQASQCSHAHPVDPAVQLPNLNCPGLFGLNMFSPTPTATKPTDATNERMLRIKPARAIPRLCEFFCMPRMPHTIPAIATGTFKWQQQIIGIERMPSTSEATATPLAPADVRSG